MRRAVFNGSGSPIPLPLLALMAVTLAVKVFLIWRYEGFLTGDDLEIVQTAARYAAGVKYQPWDIRCLFEPLFIVWPVMKLAVICGARDPGTLSAVAAIPAVLFSTAAIAGVFALARRFGAPSATAGAAAWLYALHPLPLGYGATPFPRPISAALIVAAFLLAFDPRRRALAFVGAGFLVGMAFAVRWSEGVVLVPLLLWCLWREKDFRSAGLVLAGFAVAAFLFAGLLDRLTYGDFFHSLEAFFRTMYSEMSPIRLAQETPFPEYFRTALRWAGPIVVLLLIASWRQGLPARVPLFLGLSIVVLLSFLAHKEWRYLQSAIPFFAIAAASGWERLRRSGHRILAAAALILAVPYGLERAVTLHGDRVGSGVQAARFISGLRPPPRMMAFQQTWAYGEHLYLGNEPEICEIEWNRPLRPRAIAEAAAGADVAGVYTLYLDRAGMEEFKRLGFRRAMTFRTGTAYECAVYTRERRRDSPPPAPAASSRTVGTGLPAAKG
jgi:hypothetical protein